MTTHHKLRRGSSLMGPVAYTTDAAVNMDATAATHTYSNVSSGGPFTIIGVSYVDGSLANINSATIDGDALTLYDSIVVVSGVERVGCGIFGIQGSYSNVTVSIEFSTTVDDSKIYGISLQNLESSTEIDDDAGWTNSGSSLSLSSLTGADAEGISICMFSHAVSGSGLTWTNATEVYDSDVNATRGGMGIVLGTPAGTISCQSAGGNAEAAICGINLR